ncbi:MAG: pyridoxal phosphate-dependent aminotransferase, partial [Acidobacteriota bacterium]
YQPGSKYMEWAKTRASARFNLATSGIENYSIRDLPVSIDDIELTGASFYGYEPLQQALAAKFAVAQECVVAATGTSMANYLAMAAVLEPGDEVLIERPAYDPLLAVARYLRVNIQRFERSWQNNFRLDPYEIQRAITPRTRLIVMTNLHNPSGACTDIATLREIGEIAQANGIRVLIDEVYLEAMFEASPPSAFHLGTQFITTNSLTKVYGLSGLRCGWILAEPSLALRIWRLNDLFGVAPAHSAERLSVIALSHLDQIKERARSLLQANRPLLNQFLASRDDLSVVIPDYGTVVFPRWQGGNVDRLCGLLRDQYETTIVPGSFFEMPEHFRIGIGCNTEMLIGGLERLAAALDELA